MIDLHIHILPGLDDGPSTEDEAVRMCRMCAEEGIDTIVATPHVIPGLYNTTRDMVLASVASLQETLRKESIPVRILPGADVRIEPGLVARLVSRTICTIGDNGMYVLLEVPETLPQIELMRIISAFGNYGLRPIISHPERNLTFRRHISLLYNLVYSDVLLQMTAGSLLGYFGKEVMDFSTRLIEHRLVHILASDAHSSTTRPPGLRKGLEKVSSLVGDDEARAMVLERPAAIVQARAIHTPMPTQWKEPRRYRFMRWMTGS